MTQEINSAAFEAGVASCQFHQDNLSAAGSSPAAHFSDALGRIYVTAGAVLCSPRPQAGHTQPALTLVVEDSANGSSWATVATFDFTASDQQSAAVDSPRAYLRASWAGVVGTWAVDVAVKSIATPASGGGSQSLDAIVYDTSTPQTIPHIGTLYIAWDALDNPVVSNGSGFSLSLDQKSVIVAEDGIYAVSVEAWFDATNIPALGDLLYVGASTPSAWGGQSTMIPAPAAAPDGIVIVSVTSCEFVAAGGALQGYCQAIGAPGGLDIVAAGIEIARVA